MARDTPANVPLVLCVSEILQSPEGRPMLEVTDGWYRMRVEVDDSLARAIKRGVIREGRKIAVSGARVRTCFCSWALDLELICWLDLFGEERTYGDSRSIRLGCVEVFRKLFEPSPMAFQVGITEREIHIYAALPLARWRNDFFPGY